MAEIELIFIRCALAAAALLLVPDRAPGAPAQIRVEALNPRPFGYVIGDVVEQKLAVEAAPTLVLDEAQLPHAGPVDRWLDLRSVRSQSRPGGGHWDIVLAYQIRNAPVKVTTIALPAVGLRFAAPGGRVEERVADWPLTIAPLTPEAVLARAGLEEMRPDRPPLQMDTDRYRLRLGLYAFVLAAIGLYAALERSNLPWPGRARGPFARACRDLRRLARHASEAEVLGEAVRRLHRAFDQTAGRSVFLEQLDRFFGEHPRYALLRGETEEFFRRSRAAFFGGGEPGSIEPVLALARAFRAAERRRS